MMKRENGSNDDGCKSKLDCCLYLHRNKFFHRITLSCYWDSAI